MQQVPGPSRSGGQIRCCRGRHHSSTLFKCPNWVNVVLLPLGAKGSRCLGKVECLVGGTAADIAGLGTRSVDVFKENGRLGLGNSHGLGNGNLLIDVASGLLVNLLQIVLSRDLPVQNLLFQSGNGVVGGTHALDFLSGTVGGTGVGHGVTTIAVGDVFENHGALAGGSPFLAVLDSGLDGQDIHAINLETRNVLSALVVIGQSRRTGSRSTHTVLVV